MRSLCKLIDIIETVAGLGQAGLREPSTKTGFAPPTTHRILTTLIEHGYLKKDPILKNRDIHLTQVPPTCSVSGYGRLSPHDCRT